MRCNTNKILLATLFSTYLFFSNSLVTAQPKQNTKKGSAVKNVNVEIPIDQISPELYVITARQNSDSQLGCLIGAKSKDAPPILELVLENNEIISAINFLKLNKVQRDAATDQLKSASSNKEKRSLLATLKKLAKKKRGAIETCKNAVKQSQPINNSGSPTPSVENNFNNGGFPMPAPTVIVPVSPTVSNPIPPSNSSSPLPIPTQRPTEQEYRIHQNAFYELENRYKKEIFKTMSIMSNSAPQLLSLTPELFPNEPMQAGKIYEVKLWATYSNGEIEQAFPPLDFPRINNQLSSKLPDGSTVWFANSRTNMLKTGRVYLCYDSSNPQVNNFTLDFYHRLSQFPQSGTRYLTDQISVSTSPLVTGNKCPKPNNAEIHNYVDPTVSFEIRRADNFEVIEANSSYINEIKLGECFYATSYITYPDGRRFRLSADNGNTFNDPDSSNVVMSLGVSRLWGKGGRKFVIEGGFQGGGQFNSYAATICRMPAEPTDIQFLKPDLQFTLLEAGIRFGNSPWLMQSLINDNIRIQDYIGLLHGIYIHFYQDMK